MRAIIQRVKKASVIVDHKIVGQIGAGLLTLIGVEPNDVEADAQKLISKIVNLRIFEDQNKKMNLSLIDIKGEHLIVSQFTLLADCTQGRRPSFIGAAKPEPAQKIYQKCIDFSINEGIKTQTGIFQSDMQIELINDGPATFIL